MQKPLTNLNFLLHAIGLSDQECLMFCKAYTFPELTTRQLSYQCGFSRMTAYRVLGRLLAKDLLLISTSETDGKRHIHALSLVELSGRLTQISANMLALAENFKSLEKLHALNLFQHAGTMQLLKKDEALEAFDDMHRQHWEWNVALGDCESHLKNTGIHFNKKWIINRVKKSRKAKGIINSCGPFTKEITNENTAMLRETCMVKNLIKDQWIETFPELGTTFIFSPKLSEDNTIAALKIQNKIVTDSYAQIVKGFLP